MGMFKWKSFTLASFYLFHLFISLASSTQIISNTTQIISNTKLDGFDDILDICNIVYCGKGTCHQSVFPNFTCDCDSGWKKLKLGSFEFPTCVLPNCTINLQCGNGILPTLPTQLVNPMDPCLINLCGDGKCVRDGTDFKCQCNEGSANVLNDPKMICLKKCSIGGDCNGLDLGFNTPEKSDSPPATPDSGPGSSGTTGSGEMLSCTKKLYVLTIMMLAIIFQNRI